MLYLFVVTVWNVDLSYVYHLKDKLKATKRSNKSIWSNVFFLYVKVYMYSKSLFNTIHIDIKHKSSKKCIDKINVTKYALFFLLRSLTHHCFTLICNSYTSWSPWFIFLNLFSIFDSFSFLLNFLFLLKKNHEHFDFKTS